MNIIEIAAGVILSIVVLSGCGAARSRGRHK